MPFKFERTMAVFYFLWYTFISRIVTYSPEKKPKKRWFIPAMCESDHNNLTTEMFWNVRLTATWYVNFTLIYKILTCNHSHYLAFLFGLIKIYLLFSCTLRESTSIENIFPVFITAAQRLVLGYCSLCSLFLGRLLSKDKGLPKTILAI